MFLAIEAFDYIKSLSCTCKVQFLSERKVLESGILSGNWQSLCAQVSMKNVG